MESISHLEINHIPVPLILVDTNENQIVSTNEAFRESYGINNEIIGRSYDELFVSIPSDLNLINNKSRYFILEISSQDKVMVEIKKNNFEKPDGTQVWSVQELFPSFRDLNKLNKPIFKAVFDHARDLILIADNEGRFIEVNETACKKLGFSRDELLNMSVTDITFGPMKSYGNKKWAEFIKAGIDEGEYVLQTKTGKILYTEYKAIANIRTGEHLSVLRDVTDKKEIEYLEKLKTNAIEYSGHCVACLDSGFRITYVNKACLDTWEIPEKECVKGEPLSNFFAQTNRFPLIKKELDLKAEWSGTLLAKTHSGTSIEVDLSIQSLNLHSEEHFWLVTMVDVTDKLEAERSLIKNENRFNKLLKAAPDGVMMIGRNGVILQCNEKACELFGYHYSELIGQPVEILLPDTLREKHVHYRESYARTPAYRPMDSGLELAAKKKDGSVFPVDISLGPLENDDEYKFMAIIRDVSKFKQAKDKIEEEKNFIRLIQKITSAANKSVTLDEIISLSIDEICNFMNWPAGHAYLPSETQPNTFEPSGYWYLQDKEKYEPFKVLTQTTTFQPGKGMIGDIIQTGKPQWVINAHTDKDFIRRYEGLDLGIRSCFGFPVHFNNRIYAILEFFSDKVQKKDLTLLKRMAAIGHPIGRVAERRESEKELVRREAKYRSLFESARHAIFILKNGTIMDFNKAAEEMLGVYRNKSIEKPLDMVLNCYLPNIYSDNSRQKFLKKLNKTLKNLDGPVINMECDFIHFKSKNVVNAELDIIPIKLETEKFIQLNIRDVTERNKAEKLIKKNAELFSQLFQNSPIGVVMLDKAGNVEKINKSFENIFGYQISEIEGKVLYDFFIPEEEKINARNLNERAFDGTIFQVESERLNNKGERVPVLIGGCPVQVNGKTISIFGMYVDLREIKKTEKLLIQSEYKLKEAQRIAKVGNWEVIHKTKKIEWSDEVYRIFEAKRSEFDGTHQSFLKFVHPDDREKVNRAFQQSLNERKHYSIRHRILLANNRIKYLEEQCENIFDEDGNPVRSVGTVQDVTEKVLAQQKIEKSLKEKEILLSEIHHRVKNNLAIISGLLELEVLKIENEEIKSIFTSSISRIHSIAKIHELLYSTNDFSNIPFRQYVANLADRIQQLYDKEMNIVVDMHIDEIGLNINQAIPTALILNELLTNAYKHAFRNTKKGKVEIILTIHRDIVNVKIVDNGEGMPNEFDPKATSTLGYSLITTLCKQLGAELTIKSDQGTNISFDFKKQEIRGASYYHSIR